MILAFSPFYAANVAGISNNFSIFIKNDGMFTIDFIDQDIFDFRPAINLKFDISITKGSGIQEDPYVIEKNITSQQKKVDLLFFCDIIIYIEKGGKKYGC